MSSSNSPCAACKFLRRKCTQKCVFAPYFPPDQPQKFASVHKIFGASNVSKILNDLNAAQREDAVNSLAYEAEERLRDPVYGCVGLISILQHRLKQLQSELVSAKKELANYIGPQAMIPVIHPHNYNNPSSSSLMPHIHGLSGNNHVPMMGVSVPTGPMQQHPFHTLQILEAQQMAVIAAREQEALKTFDLQQLQHADQNLGIRFSGAQEVSTSPVRTSSPSLGLGTFDHASFQIQPAENHQQQHQHHQLQEQFLLQQLQPLGRQENDHRKSLGPPC